jgi:hypothetical protein
MPEDLRALVYVSTARHLLLPHELGHLLQAARIRNRAEQVTGMLLYSDGNFMQYLEGPPQGLSTVYGVIRNHRLHHGLIELFSEPAPQREFSDWAMAFRSPDPQWPQPTGDDGPALDIALAGTAQPLSLARMLLLKFWTRRRAPFADT